MSDKGSTQNKTTVMKYIDGFNKSDHSQILSCLTDDVVWDMPGFFHLVGKSAFDKEIENPAFVGSPTVQVTRLTEENNVVAAEGTVRCARRDGGMLDAVFCDVFEMKDGKIRHLISYLNEIKEGTGTFS
jgi:ketosteroid isomerase-like protein